MRKLNSFSFPPVVTRGEMGGKKEIEEEGRGTEKQGGSRKVRGRSKMETCWRREG